MTEGILEFLLRKASLDMFLIYLSAITDVGKKYSGHENYVRKSIQGFLGTLSQPEHTE